MFLNSLQNLHPPSVSIQFFSHRFYNLNIETGTAINLIVYFTDCLFKEYRSSGLRHETGAR